MPRIARPSIALVFTLATGTAVVADEAPSHNVVPPPPAEELNKGELPEPDVKITRKGGSRIEEYSYRGRVYAIKIDPVVGPVYYLYDFDGDGAMESPQDPLQEIPKTAQWRLFEW